MEPTIKPRAAPPELGLAEAIAVMDTEKTDLDKIIDTMLQPQNINHLTELNRNEILAFTAMSALAKEFPELDVLKEFIATNLMLRVSKGRKGRGEIVKILSRPSMYGPEADTQQRTGLRRWFRR